MDLLHSHHSGSVIRFGLLFMYPSLCIPDTFSTRLRLPRNYSSHVRGVNNFIGYLMSNSCSKSSFGSLGKHVGITVSGKGWKAEAWEGFNPAKPASIIKCSKLTPPYQKKRSVFIRNSINSEIRAFPEV